MKGKECITFIECSRNKVELADILIYASAQQVHNIHWLKFHAPNDVTNNGSSKNYHNMLWLHGKFKNFHIWKLLNFFLITCVPGTLHWSQCSVAPFMILCKCSQVSILRLTHDIWAIYFIFLDVRSFPLCAPGTVQRTKYFACLIFVKKGRRRKVFNSEISRSTVIHFNLVLVHMHYYCFLRPGDQVS